MTNDYEPTGDRDRPPTMDRMAYVLQLWDIATDHPRDEGHYLDLAAQLLALDDADDAEADIEAPVYQHCLFPTCFLEVDVATRLDGNQAHQAPQPGVDWRKIRPPVATGYVCPEHAPIVQEHAPRWAERTEQGAVLACACGWISPTARWPRYAAAAWQNHLLETGETA
ncbi:hypothetical protein GCM10017744_102430 [Streptomyces antimycoticus]|uniref:Uncharacterized protein n=1 Tax=Streptomyces antimycoticus TaxID=68175 RepID=A0A4D4KQT9_9ACTN|nr:hypothetical protein [Streptomyces antimycoticus]GDY49276.1 hypothetical protein SANT12839_101580 [Streptomyces antimycoticus]